MTTTIFDVEGFPPPHSIARGIEGRTYVDWHKGGTWLVLAWRASCNCLDEDNSVWCHDEKEVIFTENYGKDSEGAARRTLETLKEWGLA